ncbi:cyclic nucleotide-binding domain-containing protein [Curvivirga sp.]|uniref:cyclic nucleotide-binding domain-containing protein n=1 Tax=Curvivirga sp. TaxID=2856848 RepID=UPI003B598AD8
MSDARTLIKNTFQPNELIFKAGDSSNEIFLIHDGTVELFEIDEREHEKRIKLLSAGYAFGEQALISSEKRKYYARAMTSVTCVAVNKRNLFKQLNNEDPFIAALFRILQGNMQSIDKMSRSSKKEELDSLTDALSLEDK